MENIPEELSDLQILKNREEQVEELKTCCQTWSIPQKNYPDEKFDHMKCMDCKNEWIRLQPPKIYGQFER